VDTPIAADESVRRAEDPLRVRAAGSADIVVLKVQPLGGVRAALEGAEACGLPVVVSSAVETSVGLAAGLALAAALPELPYACGLGTLSLLEGDVAADPLTPVDGAIEVRRPEVAEDALRRYEIDDAGWHQRAADARAELDGVAR
jgi:O-succinylbenzoate synthase